MAHFVCSECGAEITAGVKFCSNCGAPIIESELNIRKEQQFNNIGSAFYYAPEKENILVFSAKLREHKKPNLINNFWGGPGICYSSSSYDFNIYIDKITYGNKIMYFKDIEHIRYGALQVNVNGFRGSESYIVCMKSSSMSIEIECLQSAGKGRINKKKRDEGLFIYNTIINNLNNNVIKGVVNKSYIEYKTLSNINMCNLNITNKGINFEDNFLSWNKFDGYEIIDGRFCIKKKSGNIFSKVFNYWATFSLRDEWDVVCLPAIFTKIANDIPLL
jgi:hypothetical protein